MKTRVSKFFTQHHAKYDLPQHIHGIAVITALPNHRTKPKNGGVAKLKVPKLFSCRGYIINSVGGEWKMLKDMITEIKKAGYPGEAYTLYNTFPKMATEGILERMLTVRTQGQMQCYRFTRPVGEEIQMHYRAKLEKSHTLAA